MTTASTNGPADSMVFRLTRPFRIEAFEEPAPQPGPGTVLLRPLRSGICGSDIKLYAGRREPSALANKLPIALLHESVAEVASSGERSGFSPGQRVVPCPNIPCTIAHPDRHPGPEQACPACRPGGAGANYCTDGVFLSSNVDGMARTAFLHPSACTVPVPEETSDEVAVLTEPFATVLAGLEQAAPDPGSTFLVLGNGALGILTVIALHATLKVEPHRILITGHNWDARADAVEGLAIPVEADGGELARELAGRVDTAFECVGAEATEQTLSLAVDLLRPGGTAVLLGPSETPLLFDTRKVIGKGLRLIGCNRALLRHFSEALRLASQRGMTRLLERAIASKEFIIRSAEDLDEAFYYAWTKSEPGRAITRW